MFIKIATLTISERLDNCQILRTLLQNIFQIEEKLYRIWESYMLLRAEDPQIMSVGMGSKKAEKRSFALEVGELDIELDC